jgi:hypothetical protein
VVSLRPSDASSLRVPQPVSEEGQEHSRLHRVPERVVAWVWTGSTAAYFTYEERRQLKRQQNWGGESMRAGADSIKDFDACSLCLHLAEDPVVWYV